ncbi:hypothetical protein C9374_004241 [Naegleria lovaniensis]|uniref:Beta-amylase n=1 Tax=Naegleria lovaniensis TaxID=51637 RepID=A0AA88KLE4_NAELO|nr:uncharacterized protein C9374_004241 [Naegleria lovaniensis]KAG2383570.1 hypothetical protein C9374_004241 [Naegleria lovaniensis]
MPLNTVNNDGSLNNPSQIRANLQKVKSVGTDGIMIDVWWGICEQKSPQSYNFTAYQQLFTMCQQIGLKVEPVMSFHQCGTNIGDAAYIPLPNWVLQVGQWNPDIFYTDQNGHRDREYLSLGVDNVAIFPTSVPGKNRTAVDIYSDFMTAFRNTFSSFIQSGVIDVIEIGLGPAGEMRYPSYQLQNNLWSFPGIGAFQCYDKYMLNNLAMAAKNVGHPEWGTAGPNDAGYYNSMPYQTGFFSDNTYNNYASNYGQFFLNWYSGMLIQHGNSILQRARSIFGKNAKLAAKIAGIHWCQYNIDFEFTCMEMIDSQQPSNCACGPAELVALTRSTAWKYGLDYGGENALDIEGNTQANAQIVKQSSSSGKAISGFTYLRMSDSLLNSSYNFNVYAQLVNALHQLEMNTKSSNSNDTIHILKQLPKSFLFSFKN